MKILQTSCQIGFFGADYKCTVMTLSSGASLRKGVWVQVPSSAPYYTDKKDIMPTKGCTKPFVGINLLKNRNHHS